MFFTVIFFLFAAGDAAKCSLNDCSCTLSTVDCSNVLEPLPKFDFIERFYTREITLTDKQNGLLDTLCSNFPNILVLKYHGTICPVNVCVTTQCR